MALTTGKQVQCTFVFVLPVGISESGFLEEIHKGMSMSAKLMPFARGVALNVVPEPQQGSKTLPL